MIISQIKAVMLPVDGVLVDSHHAHALAWRLALCAHRYDVPLRKLRRLIGLRADQLLCEVLDTPLPRHTTQSITQLRHQLFLGETIHQIRPFPLVPALLARMHDAGLRLVVGDFSNDAALTQLLAIADATERVERLCLPGEPEQATGNPVISALVQLGYTPTDVVMVGSTPYHCHAAERAGVPLIALRCGGWEDGHLSRAIALYDDPADLLANFATSPLGVRP